LPAGSSTDLNGRLEARETAAALEEEADRDFESMLSRFREVYGEDAEVAPSIPAPFKTMCFFLTVFRCVLNMLRFKSFQGATLDSNLSKVFVVRRCSGGVP